MGLRFIRLFIYSIISFILEKIKKIYFTTKYYNNSLKVSPPSRSYDMNNVPLLLELENKNEKRLELLNRFHKNIWKLDNISKKHLIELNKFNWLSQLDIKIKSILSKI